MLIGDGHEDNDIGRDCRWREYEGKGESLTRQLARTSILREAGCYDASCRGEGKPEKRGVSDGLVKENVGGAG